ncbi:MAG: alanyl-tRNA editing protein [Bacilli bacterium]|jgi:Ser-tRNA(Ala) deacylase AlaX|nr:alanyl-tRNA editing protein [Bacilli bacterium]
MMVNKLFWQDPYLDHCDAIVTSVSGNNITVDQTVAYAFSGGQESDMGTIGGFNIISATKRGLDIIYTLENHSLKEDDHVEIKIDMKNRHRLMRLHSCGDICLQIILKNHPELNGKRVGANVSPSKARIDFNMDYNISSLFPEIETELNKIINQKLPLVTAFEDDEKQIRYWEIAGYPKTRCGGTHVKNTAEIGKIRLKRKNIGGGKERIEMIIE